MSGDWFEEAMKDLEARAAAVTTPRAGNDDLVDCRHAFEAVAGSSEPWSLPNLELAGP